MTSPPPECRRRLDLGTGSGQRDGAPERGATRGSGAAVGGSVAAQPEGVHSSSPVGAPGATGIDLIL
ncbi:hypothetical protein [Demequina litorisediminis]|uniref:hypothetical protein n=1 Tax=Demequina litorisediminis TaxID=1849022 RepID=UPI0024E0E9C9|nr:hypothetical protein [Demequina litorisediminis]